MKKIILISSMLFFTSNLFSYENETYTEFNYEEELSSEISKALHNVHDLHLKNRQSFISNKNKIISEIENRNRVKFLLKDYKKVDIYIREDYSVISDKYVLKNPPGWRRILIKETNIWE